VPQTLSKRTKRAFSEYLSHFSVLNQISGFFDDADIEYGTPDETISGARRSLVSGYYSSIDWDNSADVRKVISAIEIALIEIGVPNDYEGAKTEYDKLIKLLSVDGYVFVDARLTERAGSTGNMDVLLGADVLDENQITRAFSRLSGSIEDDPDAAIGSAKELIETVCKHILDELGIAYKNSTEASELVKLTAKELRLVPDAIPNSAKGADTIKRMLSNLGTISHNMAELRNLYGTGHGKSKNYRGLSAHARLAVNSSLALTVFLVETHKARES